MNTITLPFYMQIMNCRESLIKFRGADQSAAAHKQPQQNDTAIHAAVSTFLYKYDKVLYSSKKVK